MKRFIDRLRKKKEEEPEVWQSEESVTIMEPVQEIPESTEWGKDHKVVFKHNTRIKVIRILAVAYTFLNIIIGLLFTSNSLLINLIVFLYLVPNTIIMIHYLKLIQEKISSL